MMETAESTHSLAALDGDVEARQKPEFLSWIRDFTFPSNIYAALLLWSEGRCEGLHFGLFDSGHEPFWQAQTRASQVLWAQMPAPCRVLDVGIGTGHTLARLQASAYDAVGLTPELAQLQLAKKTHGPHLSVELSRLQDFARKPPADALPFDAMLLHDSAQYIQPLALFDSAHRLLNAQQATLLVMDEFALQRRSAADQGLHLLPHFKALAQRYGWRLAYEEDWCAAASHTLAALLSLLQVYRSRLHAELGLAEADIDSLQQALRLHQSRYQQGVYGYRLLRFERQGLPAHRPVALDARGSDAMRELFSRIFGHPLSQEEWQWKYGEGRGQGVGWAAEDGRFSAFFGGLSRSLRVMGQPMLGCQVADVMVAPEVKVGLRRRGAFYELGACLLEAQIGWGQPHDVGFGFPNARHVAVGERVGLYAAVDQVISLWWEPLAPTSEHALSPEAVIDAGALQPHLALWHELQAAWQAMAAAFEASALAERDPAWLSHRYGRRPGVSYKLLRLREASGSGCLGVAVVRERPQHQTLELMDLIAPPEHFQALITLARLHAYACGLGRMECWISASHAHHLQSAQQPAQAQDIAVTVPANIHTAGMAPQDLQGRWFLMSGDTDFR